MSNIEKNLQTVKDRISRVCERTSRPVDSVKLVAVSKKMPASSIRKAFDCGQFSFGENYAQEFRDKNNELCDLCIDWHFIGHLQKNKVKYVAPKAKMIETIDSLKIAEVINAKATDKIDCLIEVNIGDESSKAGTDIAEIENIARGIAALPNLDLRGLMIIPPYEIDPEDSRPHFKKLKEMLELLNERLPLEKPLTELSMGMSHDFEVAIEEGATIVRVGTAIFGERDSCRSVTAAIAKNV